LAQAQQANPIRSIGRGPAGAGDATHPDMSIVQSSAPVLTMPSPVTSFDGVSNTGWIPPDTEGDIGYDPATGRKYYMQFVNKSYQIWDVTNPAAPFSVAGPAAGTNLWSSLPSSNICRSTPGGDPIVLFDHLANRWLASQLAWTTSNYHQCMAVSQTGDPAGSWYAYDFLWSITLFNDYPKLGVWPDGYYLSVNEFTGATTWAGAGVAVFDRAAMLSGSAATMQKFDLGNYGGMLPSDLDGPAPSPGTPNYFVEWDDGGFLSPLGSNDALGIWQFHVDWSTPANTTFGASSFAPNQVINTASLNVGISSIPQPSPGSALDALADRLMYRLQYRDFGDYQTLVANHTVNVTSPSSHAGVYWFEMHNTGTWSMYQQGTYAPDTDSRWMGSVALDRRGDMGVGYSVSSSSTKPSVRYSGRLAGDALGTLPQGESTLIAGTGVQLPWTYGDRWGDYSTMSVDPTNDCTFWYTQQYYASNSQAGWKTRIASFRFPSCPARAPSDYDGDGRTDPAKYVPAAGAVYYYKSTDSTWGSAYIGTDGQYILNSDFDGDGKTDPAKYVSAAGAVWYLGSADNAWHGVYIGSDGQFIPASDFDGDGKTDPAKYVAAAGAVWYLGSSDATWHGVYIGSLGGGEYVPGSDFDGDGVTDPAHTDSAGNVWYLGSADSTLHGHFIGNDGPYVPRSDYDGDGKTDPAKFTNPSIWYLQSGNGYALTSIPLGADTSAVVPGPDFDGDGITDPAKFVYNDPNGSIWYTRSSNSTLVGVYMGNDIYIIVD